MHMSPLHNLRSALPPMAIPPKIMLQSGAWFDLLDPDGSTFTIEDIAHGLANVCRYAGQCRTFYSVAEHSLKVSETCPDAPFAALLHDAAEAFVGDVSRPLKQLIPQYKLIEDGIETAILARFGLPTRLPPAVKTADMRVLAAERVQLMPTGAGEPWRNDVEPAPITIECLVPRAAKAAFLRRFQTLHAAQTRAHSPKRVAATA